MKDLIIDSITKKIEGEFNENISNEDNHVPLIFELRRIIKEKLLAESNAGTESSVSKKKRSRSFKDMIKSKSISLLLKKLSTQNSKEFIETVDDIVNKIIFLIKTRVNELKNLLFDILDIIKFKTSGNYNLEQTINKTIQVIIIFSVLNVADIIMEELPLSIEQLTSLD